MVDKEMVFWSDDIKAGEESDVTTWFRAVGIGNFLNDILKENEILGVIMRPSGEESENIFGFIIRERK